MPVIITGLMLSLFLASLDQTILTTSVTAISGDMGGIGSITWILVSYTVAMTIGIPVYGKLGDQFGHKKLFLTGNYIFIVSSLLAGFSQSLDILTLARFGQGFGAAGIMILSQAIIADITTVKQRAKYSGPIGAVFGVSAISGPFIGGFLTENFSWHWNFWINIPIGIAVILIVSYGLTTTPAKSNTRKIDYAGILFMSFSVILMVLISSWAGSAYAWSSPAIITMTLALAFSVAMFIHIERYAQEPIIPLGFFKSRIFTACTLAGISIGAGLFGIMAYLPTYFQKVHGASLVESGLLMLPMLVLLFIGNIFSGLMISSTGKYRIFPVAGLGMATIGLYLMASLSSDSTLEESVFYTTVIGFGLGLSAQNIIFIVQNAMPANAVGTVTASNAFFREIGVSLGMAIFGSVFTSHLIDMNMNDPKVAYNDALTSGFAWLVPVLALGFLFTCFIPGKELSLDTGLQRKEKEAELQKNGECDVPIEKTS